MVNKNLFASTSNTTVNETGGMAYKKSSEEALAQYAITGMLDDRYYATAQEDFNKVITLAKEVSDTFLAKVAVYAKTKGFMKDMPIVLLTLLSKRDTKLFRQIFPTIINNGKSLLTFIRIIRSGMCGRKSLGRSPKNAIKEFLENKDYRSLMNTLGDKPNLKDVIKLSHPKGNDERQNFFKYVLGIEHNVEILPEIVKEFEMFKKGSSEVPNLDFRLLTSNPLEDSVWTKIAKQLPWQALRMNLNTLQRHNAFNDSEMINLVASKLKDELAIKRSNVFPYQLFTAYKNIDSSVPNIIAESIIDACEIACNNVPSFGDKKIVVATDTSGSMDGKLNGKTVVRYIDVAALFSSVILKSNPDNTQVIPFDTKVHDVRLSPRDSIITNAEKLSRFGGGGTNCGAVVQYLNDKNQNADVVILISDNESWSYDRGSYYSQTTLQHHWKIFKKNNPNAKLICIDIVPNSTQQAKNDKDILFVGGFSDNVFTVIQKFIDEKSSFVDDINAIEI